MDTIPQNQDRVDPIDRQFADPWIPDPGDVLRQSEVLYVSERPDGFDEDKSVPIVTFRVGPGSIQGGDLLEEGIERAVHGIHVGLRAKFADLAIKPGDLIAIKFLGWFRKGAPADGLGPKEVPQGAKTRDGSFRYRVVRYGDEKAGIDWAKYKSQDDEPQGDLFADTTGLAEHSRMLNRPLEDDSDATTAAALQIERDERDDAGDIPF
jgi:hypothetical protein